MIGKILLTVLVILIAFLFLRQRKEAQSSTAGKSASTAAEKKRQGDKDSLATDLRIGAYLFLILMVGIGAGIYYTRWQDDHTILTVTLHSNEATQPVTYEVYKYQMGERTFTTIEGTTVTVASSERMEVEGLAD